jgi:hypothetical protein
MRGDGGSSADEENRLKDFLRRNAREERDVRIKIHKDLEQRDKDMKIIDKCRFERTKIPQELIAKYGDELTEQNYNLPRKNPNEDDKPKLTKQ